VRPTHFKLRLKTLLFHQAYDTDRQIWLLLYSFNVGYFIQLLTLSLVQFLASGFWVTVTMLRDRCPVCL